MVLTLVGYEVQLWVLGSWVDGMDYAQVLFDLLAVPLDIEQEFRVCFYMAARAVDGYFSHLLTSLG